MCISHIFFLCPSVVGRPGCLHNTVVVTRVIASIDLQCFSLLRHLGVHWVNSQERCSWFTRQTCYQFLDCHSSWSSLHTCQQQMRVRVCHALTSICFDDTVLTGVRQTQCGFISLVAGEAGHVVTMQPSEFFGQSRQNVQGAHFFLFCRTPLLDAPFAEQKLFNFMKSHFPFVGLIPLVTGILFRALAMHASWTVS